MAFITAAEVARITFHLRQTSDNEMFQFGISTGTRTAPNAATLLDLMATWWDDEGSSAVCQTTCDQITYSEWSTVGFTGWHQRFEKLTNITSSTGAALPPQIAAVVSMLNSTDRDEPLKRRRGRSYVGLIPVASLASDGRLSSAARTVIETAWQLLLDTMSTAPGVAYSGPVIWSAAAGKGFEAETVGVGLALDTQRRRRQKLVESIVYNPFS